MTTRMKPFKLLILLFALAFSANSLAADESPEPLTVSAAVTAVQDLLHHMDVEKNQRLTGYAPSYIAYLPEGGTPNIQFFLSLQYPFPLWVNDIQWGRFKFPGIFFSYEGLYGFYLGSLPSSPVISRRQNPGLRFSLIDDSPQADGWNAFHAGYYHESNGQAIENAVAYQAAGAQAQNQVSRGWDYVGLQARYRHFADLGPTLGVAILSAYPGVRIFTGHQGGGGLIEEDDFWEAAPRHPHIAEYDGLRLLLALEKAFPERWGKMAFHYWGLTAELRAGTYRLDSLANVTSRATLTMKFGAFPVYAFFQEGYGKYISEYSARDTAWGVGLRLW
jgi:outer membrane phospholipase A